MVKVASDYAAMLNAVADHQRLLLKYGWGVARSQRDEIERMVSRIGLRTPMPPEYMEFHEKQQRAEVDSVREVRVCWQVSISRLLGVARLDILGFIYRSRSLALALILTVSL